MIEPTDEMRAPFLADHEDACDGVGCGRAACLDVRLAAVLAIVERDYRLTCAETIEIDGGLVVHCTRAPDGHRAHRGHHNAGGVFW